ncbi:MAG: hypothetical protein Q8O15_10600 [Rectinemataceae bacterium]|nr:hypothetical protein [Rectinemataceae bacterium]
MEHFIPKSLHAEAIYEWSNYRLASSIVNARKRDHEGIFDPFFLAPKTFFLEFVTGSIYPNPALREPELSLASATIEILGLDDPMHREMRARHFLLVKQGLISPDFLERMSPFVYSEARRQGLL